jgi:hypothetical protein
MKRLNIWIPIAVIMLFSISGFCEQKATSTADKKTQEKKPVATKKTEPSKSVKFDNNTVLKLLEQKVNLSDLRSDMSFSQAMEVLRNSTKPPVRIAVLWGQLEQINVGPASRISMDGFSEIPLRTGLKILLASVSNGQNQLDYWTTDGVIVIGTKDSKPKVQTTRLYNVCDLTSRPADYYAFGAGVNQGQAGQMGAGAYGQAGAANFGQTGFGGRYGGGGYGGMGMYGGGGGYGGFGTRTMGLRSGTSLSAGAWGGQAGGAGYPGGYNQMGMAGMGGMGGMGFNTIGTQIRQQQLAGLIKNTIEPGTWNP